MNLFSLEINKLVSLSMSLCKQIQPLIKPKDPVTRFRLDGCKLLTSLSKWQNPLRGQVVWLGNKVTKKQDEVLQESVPASEEATKGYEIPSNNEPDITKFQ